MVFVVYCCSVIYIIVGLGGNMSMKFDQQYKGDDFYFTMNCVMGSFGYIIMA